MVEVNVAARKQALDDAWGTYEDMDIALQKRPNSKAAHQRWLEARELVNRRAAEWHLTVLLLESLGHHVEER